MFLNQSSPQQDPKTITVETYQAQSVIIWTGYGGSSTSIIRQSQSPNLPRIQQFRNFLELLILGWEGLMRAPTTTPVPYGTRYSRPVLEIYSGSVQYSSTVSAFFGQNSDTVRQLISMAYTLSQQRTENENDRSFNNEHLRFSLDRGGENPIRAVSNEVAMLYLQAVKDYLGLENLLPAGVNQITGGQNV